MANTVLVVEDDNAIRSLVTTILKREGFKVDVASDGRQALQLIDANTYEAVILDLMMPNVSGFDVLARLAEVQPTTNCVVLISAGSEAMLDGVNVPIVRAKLRKPFEIEDLLAAVQSCQEKGGATQTKNYPERHRPAEK
jgi:DNA-binding response OmpR family regulator